MAKHRLASFIVVAEHSSEGALELVDGRLRTVLSQLDGAQIVSISHAVTGGTGDDPAVFGTFIVYTGGPADASAD